MSKYLLKSILLLLVINLCLSGMIVPDQQNPIFMVSPTNSYSGQQFVFMFSLPKGSPGLAFKQFIGVRFPQTLASALSLDTLNGTADKYSCALSTGTTNITVSTQKPVASPIVTTVAAEKNIAYCRVDDMANTPLKAQTTYKLTITLGIQITTVQFINNVGLFTSTSNNPEKIIIDSIPVMGSIGQYADYINFTPKALEIVSVVSTATTGPSAATDGASIYPFNNFDLAINLKANSFITAVDHYIVFRYPTDLVTPAQSIVSNDILATDPLKKAIVGSLT